MLAPPPSFTQDHIGDIAEQVQQFSFYRKQIAKNQHVKRKIDINLTDLLNMEVLDEIRQEFLKNEQEVGSESLTTHEFMNVLSKYLPRPDIEKLYQKIDVNDDGNVDWQEFTGFLTTSNTGSTALKFYSKVFTLKLEQEFHETNHRDLIDFICFSAKPIPVLATAGRDGQILIWNQSDFKRIGAITHYDKSEVFFSNMMSKLTIHQKAMIIKNSSHNPVTTNKRNVLITSLAMMPLSGHICVSSGDCCVSLYDLSSQEICGRITTLTHIPTTLETFMIVDKIKEVCNQYLVIGDSKGKIFLIQFDAEFGTSLDAGSKKKNQLLMIDAVKNMTSAVPHRDWITSMIYVSDLNRLIIGSMDGTVSLFNHQNMMVDRVFHGHKGIGVRCAAWCNSNKFLLSVATDRKILIWDPYTLRINMTIDNLSSMIVYLTVNDRLFEIIAVLEDKSIRTWDAVTFEPTSTVLDSSIQFPTNIISSALFVPSINSLYTAGNRLLCWQPERTQEALVDSNDDDILAVLYNPTFFLILMITRSGVVTSFQLSDGTVINKFSIVTDSTPARTASNPKGDEKLGQAFPNVTHASFDFSYRRLIVITKECCEIQIWNFHNGQCLKVIRPRLPTSLYPASYTNSASLSPTRGHTFLTHQPTSKPYLLTTVLYQHIYYGPLRLPKKYIVFGTDIGVASCLIEHGDEIDEESTYNLVLPNRTGKGVTEGDLKSKSIVWIIPSSENKVLIRYNQNDVVQWDLEKSTAGVELCRRANEVGESFVALRRKVVAHSSQSISSEKPITNSATNQDFQPVDEESESRPTSPDESSRSPILSLPQTSKSPLKANGKRVPSMTQPTLQVANSLIPAKKKMSTVLPPTISRPTVSLRHSRIIKPGGVMQDLTFSEEGASILRAPVAPAAVVGVARSTFRRANLNPLEESIESSLSEFTTSQSIEPTSRRSSTRVSILHPARPAGSRLTESSLLGSTILESPRELPEAESESMEIEEQKKDLYPLASPSKSIVSDQTNLRFNLTLYLPYLTLS